MIISGFLSYSIGLEAQFDSILLDTVSIKDAGAEGHNTNLNTIILNPDQLANFTSSNLGQALESQTSIFVKSFGAGSVSTISMRGGSSSQTLVQWQGISINNPMLGLNDLSLIPLASNNRITIEKGGLSAIEGNGAITGKINIEDKYDNTENTSASIDLNHGSFSKKFASAQLFKRFGKLSLKVSGISHTSSNEFVYIINDSISRRNQHAKFNSKAFTFSGHYFINGHSSLSSNIWLQNTMRQIPPTTTQTRSKSSLADELSRYHVKYSFIKNKMEVCSQLAYLNEANNFLDSINMIFTNNLFKKLIHKSSLKSQLNNGDSFRIGYEFNHTQAQTAFYEEKKSFNNLAIFSQYIKEFGRNRISITGRKEWSNIFKIPFIPALTYDIELSPKNKFSFKISKEFRSPTSNELFWRPGGNIDLKPEEGWNQEISLLQRFSKNQVITTTLYHRTIKNWILWSLPSGSNFYVVQNIANVDSYGLDLNYHTQINYHQTIHNFDLTYAYTKSINQEAISNPIILKGEQLFYTPVHKVTLNYSVMAGDWTLGINSSYTGITIGLLDKLEDYVISHSSLTKKLQIGNHSANFRLSVFNLFNTNYRIIERRAMPGRHFEIGINLNFNHT